MELLLGLVGCIITGIVCNMVFHRKSANGDMDVEWDEDNKSWKCTVHVSPSIDFSKKRKLILFIKNK